MLVQMLWGQAPGCLLRTPRAALYRALLIHSCRWPASAAAVLSQLLWSLFNLRPPFPQTAPRHVHMYWAAMPIAWCLALPAIPPGLSLRVSTRLLGASPAHVHALLSHEISLTKPTFKDKILKKKLQKFSNSDN